MSLALSPTPDSTHEQRMAALAYATAVKMEQAQLRRDIKAMTYLDGRKYVADLIEQHAPIIEGMSISRLLRAIHGFRHARLGRIVQQAGIYGGDRKVRDLTERQRMIIAVKLRWCG